MSAYDPDHACDIDGKCDAGEYNTSRIADCIYCGKELHWSQGKWWTWDAMFMPYQSPQLGTPPTAARKGE